MRRGAVLAYGLVEKPEPRHYERSAAISAVLTCASRGCASALFSAALTGAQLLCAL